MDDLIGDLRNRLEGLDCYTVGYGHIGDSNLHINVLMDDLEKKS